MKESLWNFDSRVVLAASNAHRTPCRTPVEEVEPLISPNPNPLASLWVGEKKREGLLLRDLHGSHGVSFYDGFSRRLESS